MAIHTVLQLLLLLSCTTTATAPLVPRASGSGAPRNQHAIRKFPSANCPNKCGDHLIEFPFGISPNCSRDTAFALICNNTKQPPRLYLRDHVAEVLLMSYAAPQASYGRVVIDFSIAISTSPGAEMYNASLKTPFSNFVFSLTVLWIDMCNFYTYLIGNSNISPEIPFCTTCDDAGDTGFGLVHGKKCNRRPLTDPDMVANAVQLKFVPVKESKQVQHQIARVGARMYWNINDQPTCAAATADEINFACVSDNSSCVDTMYTSGYSCRCDAGYTGNPYVVDGCSRDHDFDECKVVGICNGVCHNTNGRYFCAKCPGEYDTMKMKCVPSKKQIILSGIGIGLGIGFGLLLLGLSAMFIFRRWRRDIQKQLRRKYFTENHGLLLEKLIASSEDANERTKIFSLEELEQATNNFDHTRILGHGGHGMVYKGILCDKRVVAIKKSKVIKQGEIDQFINEVVIVSQINHRNIVKLYGCCLETEVPLLVYDLFQMVPCLK